MSAPRPGAKNQSDLLLWVAAIGIAAVGAAWLIMTAPWADAGRALPSPAAVAPSAPAVPAPATTTAAPRAAAPSAALDNPLRMAELAYEAGMLIEPEEYSAWTLYARVARTEPGNEAAIAGLTKVADDLVRRGETALEQGRFDFARSTVDRIRSALPDHAGANALAARIAPAAAPAPVGVPAPSPEARPVAEAEARAATLPPSPPVKTTADVLAEHVTAFEAAMAAGRLLTPPQQSAKYFLSALVATDPEHESTRFARERLSREFLNRAARSIEALDGEAAGVWIDEAQAIGVDPEGVRRARAALTDHYVALESAKPTPASSLKLVTYVAPAYPDRALDRGIEGWVDVEFTVTTDGSTRDVRIVDGSHETMFRREAAEAVGKWRFEPRVFMGRSIEQRAYTRIRFVG